MAERTISTRLTIEGEAEYKSAVRNINAELKNLEAELLKTSVEYADNATSVEALTARQESLQAVYDKQVEKVAALEKQLEAAKNAQQNYATQTETCKRALEDNTTAINALDEGTQRAGQQWLAYTTQIQNAEAQLRTLQKSSDDTTEQEAALTAQIEDAKKALEQLDDSTDGAAEGAGQLYKEQERLTANLANAEEVQQKATNAVNRYQGELTKAETAAAKTQNEINHTADALELARDGADDATVSMAALGKKGEDAGGQVSTAVNDMAQVLAASGIQQMVSEITAALEDCVSAAETYETALAKVSTIADTTEVSMDALSGEILALSEETGAGATAISEAVYQALSAGVDTAEAVAFVATANELAVGGFTETATAVDVLTTAINAYGLETSEAATLSDYLITTQNLGKTTVSELASVMGQVIPLAATYNVEMDDLSSAYAILTANGINAANSTTYLKNMIKELGDSSTTVNAALTESGYSFSELMEQGYSLGDVLNLLLESVDGDVAAFGELWSSTQAMQGALSLVNSGVETYNETMDAMADSTGAASEAYSTMADTGEMATARMEAAQESLQIAIGDVLEPTLNGLKEAGADAFSWVAGVVEDCPELVSAIAGITAGLGTMITAVTVATAAITLFKTVMDATNPTMLAVSGALAAVVALGTFAATVIPDLTQTTSAMEAMYNEAVTLSEAIDAVGESLAALGQNEATADSAKATAQTLEQLVDSLAGMDEGSAAYAAACNKIAELTGELNSAIPGLSLAFDEETGSLNMSTDAIGAYVDAWAEMEDYEAALEAQAEAAANTAEAEAELAEAQEALTEATALLDEATAAGMDTNDAYYQNLVDDYSNAAAAVAVLTDKVEESSAQEAEATEIIESYAAAQEEAAETTDEATAAEDAAAAALAELEAAYEEAYSSAKDSFAGQFSLWDELDDTVSVTTSDIRESLEEQTKYWLEYADNLENLNGRNIDGLAEFIASIDDGSEEAAAAIASLASSSDEELTSIVEQYGGLTDAQSDAAAQSALNSTSITDTAEDMSADVVAALEAMADAYTTAGEESAQSYADGVESKTGEAEDAGADVADAAVDGLEDYSSWHATGTNDVQGLIDGIRSKRASAVSEAKSLAKAVNSAYKVQVGQQSPSKLWRETGGYDMEGLIQSYEEAQTDVAEAARGVADAAYTGYTEGDRMMAANSAGSATWVTGGASATGSDTAVLERLDRLAALLEQMDSGDITVTASDETLFRVVRRQNAAYKRRTGETALA